MTPRALELVQRLRAAVADVLELPAHEAEPIVAALVATLRSARPESVTPLSTWSPTETPAARPPVRNHR